MATTGIINGTLLAVYIGSDVIAHSTSHSLSITHDARDATTKDSSGWTDLLEGLRSWEISGEGLVAYDGTLDIDDLFTSYIATRTAVTVKFSTEVSGDVYYTGSAYLTSLDQDAPTEDNVSYSYTFSGTGALTKSTVS